MGKKKCNCACAHAKEQTSGPAKRWNSDFYKKNHGSRPKEDPLFRNVIEQTDNRRGLQNAFLTDSEISGFCWEVEQVKKLFDNPSTDPKGRVWVDIRTKNDVRDSNRARWWSADQLAEAMTFWRSKRLSSTSTIRCLSFVPYVTSQILESIIETATVEEIKSLRVAACQYFGRETLLRVHTSTSGHPVFRLILNLPCLSLEETQETKEIKETINKSPGGRVPVDDPNRKEWSLRPYVPGKNNSSQLSQRFAIIETRTTVVLSGRSNTDWFGYALGNVGPVPNDDDGEDDAGPEEDSFVTGGCESESVFDLKNPIWDPRIYFLLAVDARLRVMTQASEYLVGNIDAGCQDWVPQASDYGSNHEALERIIVMTQVLRRVRKHFAQSLRAWNRFSGTGDAMYFADLRTHPTAREALNRIEKSFEQIFDLEHSVGLQEKDCAAASEILKMRMTKESNRLHLESVNTSTESLNMSRLLTVINTELSRHSEGAAASSLRSSIAAEDMSRSTRVNVQLLMLTTAVVLALQYFCSDRALFAFERSPRAFWISIAVLIPSLLALSFVLHTVDHVKEVYLKRSFGRPEIHTVPSGAPPVESFVPSLSLGSDRR